MRSLLAVLILAHVMTGCRVNYSFTGGDVGSARTVSVELFGTGSALATPQSAQVFTETLRDLLLAQTPLKLAQSDGDVQYRRID